MVPSKAISSPVRGIGATEGSSTVSYKKMTYAEWQQYQRNQMAWLAQRIGELQGQVLALQSLYDSHISRLDNLYFDTDLGVSRETDLS